MGGGQSKKTPDDCYAPRSKVISQPVQYQEVPDAKASQASKSSSDKDQAGSFKEDFDDDARSTDSNTLRSAKMNGSTAAGSSNIDARSDGTNSSMIGSRRGDLQNEQTYMAQDSSCFSVISSSKEASNQDELLRLEVQRKQLKKKMAFKQMLREEDQKKSKDFSSAQKEIKTNMQTQRLSKILTSEELKKIKEMKVELCCDQCDLPLPLKCWRFMVIENMERYCIKKPISTPKVVSVKTRLISAPNSNEQEMNDSTASIVNEPKKPDGAISNEFWKVDQWRLQLVQIVKSESGSSATDKQWQLKFAEFKNQRSNSINGKFNNSEKEIVFRAAQNEGLITNDKDLQTKKIQELKDFETETGESVLMLGKIFHEKVLFFKKQITFAQHPIRLVLDKFKSLFVQYNMDLLCKAVDTGCFEPLSEFSFEKKLEYVQSALLKFISLIVDVLITFYSMEDEIKGERDLRRELIQNLITNFVLEGEVYFLVFHLTSSHLERELQQLWRIMSDRAILENKLQMSMLNVSPQFHFDVNYRNKFQRLDPQVIPTHAAPFEKTIAHLTKISKLESPMSKLALIYSCCTNVALQEISAFWKGYNIPNKKLSIDTDNLQGMLIYIISQSNYPQIFTEVNICDKFLPKNIKKTSRFLYLEMVGTSCTYMLDQSFQMDKNKNKTSVQQDELIAISWEDLAFGRSLRHEQSILSCTPQIQIVESDGIDFTFKRTNSFEEEEESSEALNDNQLLARISEMRKKRDSNAKILKSMVQNKRSDSLTGIEGQNMDVFLFEDNKALKEDLKEKILISSQSSVHTHFQ